MNKQAVFVSVYWDNIIIGTYQQCPVFRWRDEMSINPQGSLRAMQWYNPTMLTMNTVKWTTGKVSLNSDTCGPIQDMTSPLFERKLYEFSKQDLKCVGK